MFRTIAAFLLGFSFCSVACGQTAPSKSFHLIMPKGPGAILVDTGGDWHPDRLFLYDNGTRPAVQLTGKQPGMTLSYILFPAATSTATAIDCREDVVRPLLKQFADRIDSHSVHRAERTDSRGAAVATASYVMDGVPPDLEQVLKLNLHDLNSFEFVAANGLCAEAHVSLETDKSKLAPLDASLPEIVLDASYSPTIQDYGGVASIFYQSIHNYAAAATYFDSALSMLPESSGADQRNFRRFLTDQAAMSYGMSGNIKRSRELNEAAIAKDPDYPLYYFNLACADAEEGKADAARAHLEQAFARKANTIPGEKLPDPRKDDSILKLKKNKAFWTFVETLPTN